METTEHWECSHDAPCPCSRAEWSRSCPCSHRAVHLRTFVQVFFALLKMIAKSPPMDPPDGNYTAAISDRVFAETGVKPALRARIQFGEGKKLVLSGPAAKFDEAYELLKKYMQENQPSSASSSFGAAVDNANRKRFAQETRAKYGSEPKSSRSKSNTDFWKEAYAKQQWQIEWLQWSQQQHQQWLQSQQSWISGQWQQGQAFRGQSTPQSSRAGVVLTPRPSEAQRAPSESSGSASNAESEGEPCQDVAAPTNASHISFGELDDIRIVSVGLKNLSLHGKEVKGIEDLREYVRQHTPTHAASLFLDCRAISVARPDHHIGENIDYLESLVKGDNSELSDVLKKAKDFISANEGRTMVISCFCDWGKHRSVSIAYLLKHVLWRMGREQTQCTHLCKARWRQDGCGVQRCQSCDDNTSRRQLVLRRASHLWTKL